MPDEYTPTTEFMRSLYVDATEGHREDDPDDIERAAEFDRWLAGHDAEKWDEGFDAGERDAFDLEEHPDHECIANPYRALTEKGADRG